MNLGLKMLWLQKFDESQIRRHPRGVPEGGQFAPKDLTSWQGIEGALVRYHRVAGHRTGVAVDTVVQRLWKARDEFNATRPQGPAYAWMAKVLTRYFDPSYPPIAKAIEELELAQARSAYANAA